MDHYLLVHHVKFRTEHLCVDATVDEDQCRIVSLNEICDKSEPGRSFRHCIETSCQFLILFTWRWILDLVSSILAERNLNDPNWIAASQKLRDLIWVPDSGRQPYPLKTRGTIFF